MKFCNVCDNMLYMNLSKEGNLELYCKNCNYSSVENSTLTADLCVASKKFGMDASSFKSFMNPNIKYDSTLPRVNNIKCPSCNPEKNEVIYIKYDHDNMKYIYFCCNCEQFWKN